MSDEVDAANAQVELNEKRSILYAQEQANKPIPTSEYCYWCNEKTKGGRRFCNNDCADSWEKWGRQ